MAEMVNALFLGEFASWDRPTQITVAAGSLRPESTSGNGSAESSSLLLLRLYMVLRTWVRTCINVCMLKVGIEFCGISQVCDEVMHINVGKVDMKPQRIRDCALEALRLRKRRVKRLKASKSNFYLKVMATRQRYALARV